MGAGGSKKNKVDYVTSEGEVLDPLSYQPTDGEIDLGKAKASVGIVDLNDFNWHQESAQFLSFLLLLYLFI